MSDRPDQGQPLFPRRSLTGPATEEQAAPEAGEQRRSRWLRGSTAQRDRDEGPETAAMPRVDESGPEARHPTPGAAPTGRPAAHGTQQRTAPATTAPNPAGARSAADAEHTTPDGSNRGTGPAKTAGRGSGKGPAKGPRKARLRIVRLDPWSVMKMAFALSIALAIVTVIAVAIVWSVLDTAGVWEAINTSVDTLVNSRAGSAFDVQEYVGLSRVMGLTIVVAAANIVLITALATLGAFLYNLAAALLGGFEVTLAEDR